MAYEDFSTGSKANAYCQRLSKNLGRDSRILKSRWLLGELRAPSLRSIAAEEAARAHLVVVSLHQGEHLPEEIRTWIDLWARTKNNHPTVIVALFDPVYRGVPNLVQSYLQEVAKKGDMKLWVEFTGLREDGRYPS